MDRLRVEARGIHLDAERRDSSDTMNPSLRRGRSGALIMSVALSFLSVTLGCATGTDRIRMIDPVYGLPPSWDEASVAAFLAKPSPSFAADLPVVTLAELRDDRPDVTSLGVKKNSYGTALGKIDLDEGVLLKEVVFSHLRSACRSAGYELIPHYGTHVSDPDSARSVAVIRARIRSYWCEFCPGFFVVDAEANVQVDVTVLDKSATKELYDDSFRGHWKVSGGAVTRSMFEESLNRANCQAMESLRTALPTALRLASPAQPNP
jgi:hypothetical protein